MDAAAVNWNSSEMAAAKNSEIIDEFRNNLGRVGGQFRDVPLLLLHTIGARSGIPRINPMNYQELEDGWAVFGTKAGSVSHPDWYYNLLAHPRTKIEVGPSTVLVSARTAAGAERLKIWEKQKLFWPKFARYEAQTDRPIPVVILEPDLDPNAI